MSRSRNKRVDRQGDTDRGGTTPSHWLRRWLAWQRAKSPVLRFVVMFGLLGGLFYLAMLSPVFRKSFFPWYLRLTAQLASPICNWFGQHTTASGTIISSSRFSMQIARGCDALEPLALFAAMVLAFPGPFRRKIPGVLLGAAILATVNMVRIVSLFLTAVYFPRAFGMMHLEVWQAAFILLVVVLWAFWIQWAMTHRPAASHVSG